ncbi:hypothetical protein GCM10007977_031480 [Dactylosporangium sucinum]|uniref:Uncharacterized protein n=1 Tax=Dactylosporangium sucinum TaxID=1424081 RepID=A0A917WTS0_9ACTN|nr:hypothetical protein [Dactylosporangium sucinum]GGM27883.1 hypothetical protein GCM10007977_031480 [Dactylosporangium sucinum]
MQYNLVRGRCDDGGFTADLTAHLRQHPVEFTDKVLAFGNLLLQLQPRALLIPGELAVTALQG